jgi:hypothetical protein
MIVRAIAFALFVLLALLALTCAGDPREPMVIEATPATSIVCNPALPAHLARTRPDPRSIA